MVTHRWTTLPGALALILICSPTVPVLAQDVEQGVDTSVAPGDDFFPFANGAWLRSTAIPEGRERCGVRYEIDELTRRPIATLLDGAAAAAPGSARKVVAFRAAWLNDGAIEARGLAPLRPILGSIGRVRDKAALTHLLGRWIGADVDPLNYGIYQSSLSSVCRSSPAPTAGGPTQHSCCKAGWVCPTATLPPSSSSGSHSPQQYAGMRRRN